jgi:hypothetical protein
MTMGFAAIGLVFLGLIFAALGFGPRCHQFEGIQDICLSAPGQFAFIVLAALCAIAVAFILGRRRPRSRR